MADAASDFWVDDDGLCFVCTFPVLDCVCSKEVDETAVRIRRALESGDLALAEALAVEFEQRGAGYP